MWANIAVSRNRAILEKQPSYRQPEVHTMQLKEEWNLPLQKTELLQVKVCGRRKIRTVSKGHPCTGNEALALYRQ